MNKTIILATVISVFSLTTSIAQTAPTPPAKKEKTEKGERHNPMAGLNLTEEQQSKMKTLNEDGRKQIEAVKNDASLNDDQKKSKIAELRKEHNDKRKALLTDEQQKKWEEMMKERRKNKPQKK